MDGSQSQGQFVNYRGKKFNITQFLGKREYPNLNIHLGGRQRQIPRYQLHTGEQVPNFDKYSTQNLKFED